MSLSGDLSTLDLADLLQNLERNGRSGVLALEGEGGAALYVQDGRLALLATPDRPTLVDVLVSSGAVDAAVVETARRKRRGTRRSLGETLVQLGAIEGDALEALARERLVSDVCEILAADAGGFTFETGGIPRGTFDPEERRLGIALPISPLLLESARRADHWRRIRERVPSDATHYRREGRRRPKELENDALTGVLLELCDGTRSVAEVMSGIPHRSFDAYERLSTLVEERCLRPIEVHELAAAARALFPRDRERARELVRRGRSLHGGHPTLLEVEADLAEACDEHDVAVEALKVLAHLRLDGGDRAGARDALERGLALDPKDSALRERAMELALSEERLEDAREQALALVEVWRAPGLHRRAAALLERLAAHLPEDWTVCEERARCQVDSGDAAAAAALLRDFATRAVARGDLDAGREALIAWTTLAPEDEAATAALADFESGAFERRVHRRRRLLRRGLMGVGGALVVLMLATEVSAIRSFLSTLGAISRAGLVEGRHYEEAASLLDDVVRQHPLSWTARLAVPRHAAELRARMAEGRHTDGAAAGAPE